MVCWIESALGKASALCIAPADQFNKMSGREEVVLRLGKGASAVGVDLA